MIHKFIARLPYMMGGGEELITYLHDEGQCNNNFRESADNYSINYLIASTIHAQISNRLAVFNQK